MEDPVSDFLISLDNKHGRLEKFLFWLAEIKESFLWN